MEHRYRHSGLLVASDLELPEWAANASTEGGEADVTIACVNTALGDLGDGEILVEGERLSFAVEGIGGWTIEEGRRITLYPAQAGDPQELRLFTLGSAWGALGYQRGHAMWHGSAVARGGRAVLFCGETGQGKSTFAGALLAESGVLVADDLSRVEPGADTALIHPSSARIKLWGEAVAHLGWEERVLQRDLVREDKFHCSVAHNAAGGAPMSLAAVVVLEEGAEVTLTRLRGGEALAALLAGTIYRPEMIEAMDKWGEQAALAARIAGQCPAYRLARPKDFGALGEACGAVLALWE